MKQAIVYLNICLMYTTLFAQKTILEKKLDADSTIIDLTPKTIAPKHGNPTLSKKYYLLFLMLLKSVAKLGNTK